MKHLPEHYYKAFYARDPRYDGVFFTGVTSTGVYCRPVCRARKPKRENCVFFDSAALAEQAEFRPCLLCRPELAPGLTPNRGNGGQGHYNELGERQQRRITKTSIGATPKQLERTQKLLLAKQLLTDTQLPITDVAFAAGFTSVRRFNDVIKKHYNLTPSSLRKNKPALAGNNDWINLTLGYRPPYRWTDLLNFLRTRMIPGVEDITESSFSRSLVFKNSDDSSKAKEVTGEIKVTNNETKSQLNIAVSSSLLKHLTDVLTQTELVFDTHAQPELIAENLIGGGIPGDFVKNGLGLRVPGSFAGFELAVRAILGQQVTVKAAITLSHRLCDRFCLPYQGLQSNLTRLPVNPNTLAQASVDDIASLGIIARRAQAIIDVAKLVSSEQLQLQPGANATKVIEQLQAIKGIGPWTANYIALRSLAWPDAFPKEDIVLRKALGNVSAKQANLQSIPWQPWRSYACLYLWKTSMDDNQ